MVLPVQKNIAIYQGDSFELKFTLHAKDQLGNPSTPVDLTGCTVSAQIRASAESSTAMADFSCTHNDAGGQVILKLTGAQTAGLNSNGGVWDVQVEYPNGDVKTYMAGSVSVTKEVTR